MRNTIWLFGLLSGLIIGSGFFINIGNSSVNSGPSELIRYALMFLVFGGALFLAARSLQNRQYSGEINFSSAFVAGFYIIIIGSVVYSLMWEIYFANHGEDYVKEYLAATKQKLESSDLGQLEIENRYANQEAIMESYGSNFLVRFGITMAEIFPIGLLLALVNAIYFSFIEKKNERQTLS